MKLGNLVIEGVIRPSALANGHVIDLNATAALLELDAVGSSLDEIVADWEGASDRVRLLLEKAVRTGDFIQMPADVPMAPPLRRPGMFRDFYAFETHVRNARRLRGLEINPEWYQFPVFYFSNPNTIKGPGDSVRFPRASKKWDYELEVGAILGGGGSDLEPAASEKLVAGYTVLNDWSARDIQRAEMTVNMGPAKGKDFATSLGPWLVTPDELTDRRTDKGYNLRMTVKINGELISDGNWQDIHYSFGEMIARASQDAAVYPGELFGSGTVGNGCLLERGLEHNLWLKSGDIVEMEIERLGILANTIV